MQAPRRLRSCRKDYFFGALEQLWLKGPRSTRERQCYRAHFSGFLGSRGIGLPGQTFEETEYVDIVARAQTCAQGRCQHAIRTAELDAGICLVRRFEQLWFDRPVVHPGHDVDVLRFLEGLMPSKEHAKEAFETNPEPDKSYNFGALQALDLNTDVLGLLRRIHGRS